MQHRPVRAAHLTLFLSLLLVPLAPDGSASAADGPPEAGTVSATEPPSPTPERGDPARGDAGTPEDPDVVDDAEALEDPLVIPVGEVQITATRTEREVLDVPGNVTVIDRATIEASGARDVPDLLRREAGFFVTNTTTNRAGYTVEARGFNNGGGNGGRTLVLIDGRRVNEPNGGVPDWGFVPLDHIDSIEVVRGPVNALYGDNAIAGVIHIRTRRPEPGLQAAVQGQAGTYDTEQGSVWLGGGKGPVTASVFFDGHRTDGYREDAELHGGRVEGQLLFDLAGRGELRFAGGYESQDRRTPGALTKEEMAEDRRQATPGSADSRAEPRERFVQAQLDLALTEHLTLRGNGWHRRRTDQNRDADPFFAFQLERESDAGSVEAELEVDVEVFGHRNRTILGGSFLQEDVDNDSVLSFPMSPVAEPSRASDRSRRQLWGAYLQNELDLTEDLLLVLGVRREDADYDGHEDVSMLEFDTGGTEWAPKAALSWRVCDPVSVYASWARGFRYPNLDEAFGFFGFSPGLIPETSETWEVGAKVRNEWLTLNVAAYTMNVEDEIFFDPLAPNPFSAFVTGTNVNLDRVRHRGVEFFAAVRPRHWIEIYGSYTFDDVEITRDTESLLEGSQMPITPRHRGNAGIRLFLPWGFEAGIHANYVGARYLANDVTNRLETLPKWASYDVRLAWRHAFNEWLTVVVDARAFNGTGRLYTEFGGASTFSPRIGYYPSPERHYLAGFKLEVAL